jgi:hypothetical protein
MKMKMKWLCLLGLLAAGATALAQEQPNSAQYHAVHNPNSPHYVGPNQQPAAPPARWADRWGAIADDGNGVAGIVASMQSKEQAERSAVLECKKRGGGACTVALTYHNQCAAVATGANGASLYHAETEDEAAASAMKNCEAKQGAGTCRIYYSGCSLPVQVQ